MISWRFRSKVRQGRLAIASMLVMLPALVVIPQPASAQPTDARVRTIATGDVQTFDIIPGTDTVVYATRRMGASVRVFTKPASGGPAVRLGTGIRLSYLGRTTEPFNRTDVANGVPIELRWLTTSPDGRTVVFLSDNTGLGTRSLVAVPAAGGETAVLAQVDSIGHFEVTPDSQTVVFVGDLGSGDRVYAAGLGGGEIVELGTPADGVDFDVTADSTRALFLVAEADGSQSIRSAPLDGGTPVDIAAGFDATHAATEDASTVYFIATPEEPNGFDDEYFLWSSPVDSASPRLVETDAITVGDIPEEPGTSLVLDADHLYVNDNAGTTTGLMRYTLPGDGRTRLAPPFPGRHELSLNPTGDHLAVGRVLTAPTGGATLIDTRTGERVRPDTGASEAATGGFSPDGRHVLEGVFTPGSGVTRAGLYLRSTDGTVRLLDRTGRLPGAFTPDSDRVVFATSTDRITRGLSIAPTATGRSTAVSGTDADHRIDSFAMSASGDRVVYLEHSNGMPFAGLTFDGILRSVDIRPRCNGRLATIVGTGADDALRGTPARDVIVAGAGNDTIRGRGGNDLICAGPGNDTIRGGSGNDKIFGQGGRDRILGGAGRDRLEGGSGADTLTGQRGNDRLFGQQGRDTLDGSRGNDRNDGGPGRDTCTRPTTGPRAISCER